MKRLCFFWILCAFFTATSASAQFRFGLKGGINVASASFNKEVLRSDNITGLQFGPMIEAMFGKGGIGFDLSLLYSRKGIKTEPETIKNDYLEVPLNLKFKFGTPLLNPFIAFGPYAAFCVNGNDKWHLKTNTTDIIKQMKTQNFGAGINLTAGAEIFNHLQIGVTYGWGLTDDYQTFEAKKVDSYFGKLHTWQIHATFLF